MKYMISAISLLSMVSCIPARADDVALTENKIIRLTYFPQSQGVNLDAKLQDEKDYSAGIVDFLGLGMAGAPVLDQGQYGTCVTFAATGVLDAILGKGDLVSQQCSLELDLGLGKNYWDGANYPSQIISPLQKYGIVDKSKCPRHYPAPYWLMASADYSKIIDSWASKAVKSVKVIYVAKPSLVALKGAVDKGHRVLIGFQVDSSSSEAVRGFDVIIAGKKYAGGLWACEQGKSADHCVSSNAGHEVIVVGYNDGQQLLKIRNSWSAEVGHKGDYYMSYKFFEAMAIDQSEIW